MQWQLYLLNYLNYINLIKNIKSQNNNFITKGELSKYFDYLFENLENENFYTERKTESMKDNIYNIYLKSPLTKKEIQTLWESQKNSLNKPNLHIKFDIKFKSLYTHYQ